LFDDNHAEPPLGRISVFSEVSSWPSSVSVGT
jgi:hypothetical protein